MKKYNEYGVITRPFYREQEPSLKKVFAENEEEAENMIFQDRDVKGILDVKLINEINWNNEAIEKYWSLYR